MDQTHMDENCSYQIELRGKVDEDDLNRMSPIQIRRVRQDNASTFLTIYSDQSSLIGLLRHLHARGLALLSVQRIAEK